MADSKRSNPTDSQQEHDGPAAGQGGKASSNGEGDEVPEEVQALAITLQKVLAGKLGKGSAPEVSASAPRIQQDTLKYLARQTRFHRGPLPPPEVLAGYEEAVPGSGERILQMAEAEASHRRQCENTELAVYEEDIRAERRQLRIGQIFGLVIAIVALTAAVLVAILVPGWAGAVFGTVLGTGTLASLVTVFITGTRAELKSAESSPALPPGQEDT